MPILKKNQRKTVITWRQKFKVVTFKYDTVVLFQTFIFGNSTQPAPTYVASYKSWRVFLLVTFVSLIVFLVNPAPSVLVPMIDLLSYFNLFLFFLFLGDLNTLLLFFFFIFGTFLITTNTALHLLLTAELLWITLYIIVLFVGLVYDNLNFLSLTFFFLIFSAVEFGVGLILLLLQHLLTRSLNLYDSETNIFKFMNRFNRTININRLVWKY